jgi:hypothetical protein
MGSQEEGSSVLRLGCILVLVLSLSGLAGFALEAACAESCEGDEASSDPTCQDCVCCLSIRGLLPEWILTEADPSDAPLVLTSFHNHSMPHPREISHVPRPLSH